MFLFVLPLKALLFSTFGAHDIAPDVLLKIMTEVTPIALKLLLAIATVLTFTISFPFGWF